MEKKTGVAEWAEVSINIQRGCEHDCRYCYARYDAVTRFKRCLNEHWKLPCIYNAKVDAPHKKKYDGRVMFPTTHDITPANILQYLCVFRKLLDAGNQVLVVTKPHLECIRVICEAYQEFKDQILFRFTIGSTDNDVLAFWEPGAPNFHERLDCLKLAYLKGFQTSVSCEPYLDATPQGVYEACRDFITDSFWIGIIKHFKARVRLEDATEEQIVNIVTPLFVAQSPLRVKKYYKLLDGKPLINWKDSITEIVG